MRLRAALLLLAVLAAVQRCEGAIELAEFMAAFKTRAGVVYLAFSFSFS